MINRPRFAEKVAGLSALALGVFLFAVDWFSGASGWDSLGWFALAMCVLSVAAGLAVAFLFVTQESPALPQLASCIAMLVGTIAVIALLVQVILQPGPDEVVSVRSGWWLGLLSAAGVARGGFLSMRDEYLAGAPLPDVPVRPAPVA